MSVNFTFKLSPNLTSGYIPLFHQTSFISSLNIVGMIIPTNQNKKALILDMDGRIDGITEDLSKLFNLDTMFIKYQKMHINKICKQAHLLCDNLNVII